MSQSPPGETIKRLDRQSPLPLWAQLLADLRRRLAADEFEDGFPSELELGASYGVSRNTVREATRRLRAEGSVVAARGRRPQAGSLAEIEQPLGALYSLFRSVEALGLPQKSVVRSLELSASRASAARLGLAPDAKLVHLERLRVVAGEPLAVDEVWFPADIGRPLLDADFSNVGFYDELASRTGVRLTGGEEHIRAVVLSPAQRRLLQVTPTVAALSIERLGLVRERRVEWRTTLVRGDRFGVVAKFSAGIGYRLGLPDAALPA